MRNQVFKKLFSVLLALIMVAGLLPASAMAGGWGAMDVDTTPELTETEQPAEPTPEQGEPVAEPTPEQGEPTAEPTDEGIMPANVMPVQAETENNTPTVDETKPLPPTSVGNVNYRAVMLDCGRKYFSVDNIEKLIDTMAQYGYNQLQLSFGNGGCRFLLDKMELVFTDANGATVTLSGDDVTNGIKAGNVAFNGDESVLTETEMSKIIEYANSKKIAIVPMLNMPGHMNWLKASFSGYASGKELDKLDIEKTTARNFGYALLNKYVQYFKEKCEFFHFGADESDYTGDNMTKFLTGCANVIVGAGMIPRAFNDSTRDASMPKSVQVTYWINANYIQSKNASVLDNEGYELINTHGRWYYVVNSGDADDTKSVQYANNVTVELPMLKKDKQGSWPNNLRTYFDYNNSTVSEKNHKGTMFCIWCDNSTGMPAEEIISTESYGALTQLQELAKLYWPGDITTDPETTPTPTSTPDPTIGETVNVDLIVGDETNGSRTFDVVGEMITNSDMHIATAEVKTGEAQAASIKVITDVNDISADKSYIIVNQRNGLMLTYADNYANAGHTGIKLEGTANAESQYLWTLSGSNGTYTVKNNNGEYLSLGTQNNYASIETTSQEISFAYNNNGYWTISRNGYYMNNLGGGTAAGGWQGNGANNDDGSKWTIYELVPEQAGGSKLTITATGEGNTTVKVGNTTYNIHVTAPEKEEAVTVAPNSSVTLNPIIPTEGTVTYKLENNDAGVTLAENGGVTTGEKTGNATVVATVLNAGKKVVARYTYTIMVSDINWANVTPLPVELWITNTTVGVAAADNITTADRNGKQVWTVNVSAQSAYKEEGVLLGSLVPYNGYKSDNPNVKTVYWKGTVQTTVPQPQGADLSYAGKDFTRVRYWNNAWQYQVNDNWQNFDLATNSNNTVVAFYLQISDVSPEITTGTQHYGNPPTNDPGSNSGNGYTMTTFAVVYPDGTLSRTEQQMYEKGMIRGFWGGTSINIGTIYAENNSTYKVSKITVTWGKNILGSSGSNWYTVGKTGTYGTDWGVKWDKVTNSAGDEWYNETTYWKDGDSERPMVDGNALNLNLTTENNAVLILIYLEVVQTVDTLSIVYWDDNGNKQITTNPMPMPVVVDSGVTFLNIHQTSPVNTGSFTLDDDAYILNSSGAKQGFNKNLSTVPGVTGVYMSGMYKYVSAEISGDGKTLTLHFNLKSAKKEKTFVADFGLPLVVAAKEFEITEIGSILSMSLEKNKNTMAAQGNYGRATIADDFSKVTYELNKMLNGKATIPLYVTFIGGITQEFQVHIIPATNVYYEDSFAKFTNGSGTAKDAKWTIVNNDGGTLDEQQQKDSYTNQALEALGNKTNVYGYDPAYNNCTMFSMGSARKVTVTNDMAKDGVVWPTAQFTFKGTGFDIISLTDNTSGAIFVDVTGKSTNKTKTYVVNNYYGYKYDEATNTWEADTTGGNNALYQIPVIAVRGLDYDEYNVVITVAYNTLFDKTKNSEYSFWLDAVRVYDPMGKSVDTGETYKQDGEAYPQYIKLRNELAKEDSSVTVDSAKLLFIDGAENAAISLYKNYGPNNEVYLATGQAITFKLNVGNAQIETVQIGAKAPMSEGTAKLNVNGTGGVEKELSTATEMYYDITDAAKNGNAITITNKGNAILSLTNLKITFNAQGSVSLGAMNETEQAASVMAVRALFAPAPVEPEPEPEPEKTFEPDRFEASWSRNVMQGRKATLTVKTSEDVEAITVDGQAIRSYRTRTERVGFGRRAKRITYREFTYSMVAQESADFSVTAINAEGTESEAITARLTVKTRPNSLRDMWDWFKGWF